MTPSPRHSAAKRPDDLMTVLPRKLGLVDATAIVIGDVVGTAIFLVPNSVARDLPSAAMILLVWIVTGALSFFGALAYAELGAMIPSTGGQYVFLRDSYGPLWGFLCGWSFILAIYSGANATLAVGFATYLSYFIHLTPLLFKLEGVAMIACLWAYEGWSSVSFVAGEIKQPQRNLPFALGLGVATIVALYVLAN